MEKTLDLLRHLESAPAVTDRKTPHIQIKSIFDFLFQQLQQTPSLTIFCTKDGLILSCFLASGAYTDLAWKRLAETDMSTLQTQMRFDYVLDGLLLITDRDPHSAASVRQLQTVLSTLQERIASGESRAQYLLHCLDFMDNAICIYDKKNAFLYGNQSYCRTMHIADRDAVIGMQADDILRQANVKIQYKKTGSDSWKMLDVLNSGRKALDWEFMVEEKNASNEVRYISNNLYPIKDADGHVEGVIETFHSHRMDLNKTKKLVGLTAEYTFDSIIGASPVIKERIHRAEEYAESPYNLLLYGESGVGKELFAQAIHSHSQRSSGPFVALNCANFPENLIESELFGYVGGAFTGAAKHGQIGKFELADGGTLFLDEVGELPYHFQAKLLRVLETQKLTRIGSSREINIDVRVISATNRDLEKMIEEGLFRRDLYYRLQVLSVEIPPLRERREDILLLAENFLQQVAQGKDEPAKSFSTGAKECLLAYDWPGNVRELRNIIYRVTLLSKSDKITDDELNAAIYSKGYLMKSVTNESPDVRLSKCMTAVHQAYADLIAEALDITCGNKKSAAELLGISRQTFYRMIEKYCR